MKKYLFAVVVALLFSCTNEDGARRALEGAGYSQIEFHGYAPAKCGRDDSSCTEFSAVGPSGQMVQGAVGCGVGCSKGCTIRTF